MQCKVPGPFQKLLSATTYSQSPLLLQRWNTSHPANRPPTNRTGRNSRCMIRYALRRHVRILLYPHLRQIEFSGVQLGANFGPGLKKPTRNARTRNISRPLEYGTIFCNGYIAAGAFVAKKLACASDTVLIYPVGGSFCGCY